jgi:ferrochelatase
MPFRPEPPWQHGRSVERTGLLLVNLGTPDAPTAPALRRYLAEFLGDPRVVEIPRLVWWPILHGVILRVRPAKSAAKYATIWMPEGSPLAVWTQRQAVGVAEELHRRGHGGLVVRHAMRYGSPSMASVLDSMRAEGCARIAVLPLYPQYAGATTGSVADAAMLWSQQARRVPEWRFVSEYHDDPGYIAALAASLRRHWQAHPPGERLVLSFHGVPERSLLLGDPYHCQCHKTARLLREALGLPPERLLVTFQSRFGKAKWLEPYTEPTLRALAGQGIGSVDVMCPGFVGDCLETLEEIAQEAQEAFIESGGRDFRYVPCLNDDREWIEALAGIAERHLLGWPTRAEPQPDPAQRERASALGATS